MLELFVRNTDGRGRVERTERDDPIGRRTIDQVAFRLLARSDVASVRVQRTRRYAGGKGSWR